MFITTEPTPNPATLKFLPGCEVLAAGTADFSNPNAARKSPLARHLFEIDEVSGVFLGPDFISVTCATGDWLHVKPLVLGAIMEHFTSGQPVIDEDLMTLATDSGEDDAVVAQIKDLLETRVRPAVTQDGGDIVFQRYESGIVYLHMQGACSGCPSSTATLKYGIENLLRHYIPEIVEVRPV